MTMVDSFEKIPVKIYPDLKAGSKAVAKQIADFIREKQKKKEKCVLGLATGSTPKTLYAELVRMHKEEKLSFKNVITFNLDEYYPIEKEALQSYNNYMHRLLFNHIDIDQKNIHIPNGALPKEEIKQHCAAYEKEIEEELEQIKRNAEAVNSMVTNARPPFVYDPIEDMPTLAHQTPLAKTNLTNNEIPFEYPESLNDRLKQKKIELSDKLTEAPIKDLKKAIGINDRFLFINELFRGDEDMYERSIKTIQNFSILAEAEYWIIRELKVKIGWVDTDPIVKQFDQLVKRRFS